MKRLKKSNDFPTTLKAGYRHYKLDICKNGDELNPRYAGRTDSKARLITIDGSAAVGEGAETLLHELFHVAWSNGGLSEVVDRSNEEKIINILSIQLATMIHDNPDLFKWIIKNVG